MFVCEHISPHEHTCALVYVLYIHTLTPRKVFTNFSISVSVLMWKLYNLHNFSTKKLMKSTVFPHLRAIFRRLSSHIFYDIVGWNRTLQLASMGVNTAWYNYCKYNYSACICVYVSQVQFLCLLGSTVVYIRIYTWYTCRIHIYYIRG